MKNFKKNGGFTLVELIVVIAILAILAAVAIPAYSGYIAKAEEANDLQLLGAVSTAFNSACVENNIYDMDSMIGTTIELDNNGFIVGINSTVALSNAPAAADPLFASFVLYYGDNINTPFKVFKWIEYTAEGFKGYDAEEAEGKVIEAVKQAIANSNFNGKLDELTGDVGDLIGVLGGYLEEEGANALVGTGFDEYLTNVLGVKEEDKSDPNKMANAAVLYLAHSAANMTDDQFANAKDTLALGMIDYANDPDSLDLNDLIKDLSADTGSGLASYAMLYATAEALAIQQGTDSDAYKALQNASITDPASVLTAVGNVFASVDSQTAGVYFDVNSNFDKDMDAYFQTMQAVNSKESELKNELDKGGLLTENETVQDLIDKLK